MTRHSGHAHPNSPPCCIRQATSRRAPSAFQFRLETSAFFLRLRFQDWSQRKKKIDCKCLQLLYKPSPPRAVIAGLSTSRWAILSVWYHHTHLTFVCELTTSIPHYYTVLTFVCELTTIIPHHHTLWTDHVHTTPSYSVNWPRSYHTIILCELTTFIPHHHTLWTDHDHTTPSYSVNWPRSYHTIILCELTTFVPHYHTL